MDKVFKQGIKIIEKLEASGHEAYFVGGSVRDMLMNREIGDIDIATSATPEDIQSIFPKTVDVGAAHGTIIVVTPENERYEVTTFRTDGTYSDNRRPDEVIFVKSLEEDLKRRDFTMNAIAMTKSGDVLDFFDGKRDIERRIIRTVGNASERFQEDALRMLRALRFSSQLSFSLDAETYMGIKKDAALLNNVSVERKTVEIEKMLMGQGLICALELFVTSNLYLYLPKMQDKKMELIELSKKNISELKSRTALWTLLVIVLEEQDIEIFLDAWKLPKKISKAVLQNINIIESFKKEGWNKKLIYRGGLKQCKEAHDVLMVLEWDEQVSRSFIYDIHAELPITSLKDIVLDGNELVEISNKKRGKWISLLYEELETEIIEGNVKNERAALKEWVLNWLQKYGQSS
jgi:tRNA nucleotidyltransferase (CCA-adding enzyme)